MNKKTKCAGCKYFKLFYKEATLCFVNIDNGWCSFSEKIVNTDGSCGNYRTANKPTVTAEEVETVISYVNTISGLVK